MSQTMFRVASILILFFALGSANAAPPEPEKLLVIGETSYEQAIASWSAGDAVIVQQGYLSVGAGSGADGHGSYAVSEVKLVDVSGVDFEGLKLARYGFVDGKLFSITARLQTIQQENKAGSNELSDAELKEFERKVRARYGPPTKSLRGMFAGNKPNLFVWDFRDRELTLYLVPGIRSSFQFRSKALAKKADAHARAKCKKHRPQCAM